MNLITFIESSSSGTSSSFSGSSGAPAASATASDFSQYYDPSSYWQASAGGYGAAAAVAAVATGWPGYDQSAAGQTDYAAYYQQQAVAHAQNALAQQNGTAAVAAVAATPTLAYNPEEDDMALVGGYFHLIRHTFLRTTFDNSF